MSKLPAKIGLKNRYFEEQILWVPLSVALAALYDASLGVQSFLIEVLRLTFQVLQQTCLVNHAVVGDIERRVFI